MNKAVKGHYIFRNTMNEMISLTTVLVVIAAAAMNMTYLTELRTVLGNTEKIGILTPFLTILGAGQLIPSPHLFMSAFVFFLLAKRPRTDREFMYHMIRSSRIKWIITEMLEIVLFNIVVIIILYLASVLVMLPKVTFSFDWKHDMPYLAKIRGDWSGMVYDSVISQMSLVQAFACAVGYWLLYSIFGGLLLIMIRMIFPKQRYVGLGVLFGLYFYDYICEYCLGYVFRNVSPVALSRISYLNWGLDEDLPSGQYALVFFIVAILALALMNIILAKRVDLDNLSSKTYR